MSFDAFLSQTCTITRSQQTGLDRYRNADTKPFVVASDVRCRKTQKNVRVLDPGTGEYAYIKADLVLFPAGTNVQQGDDLTIGSQIWTAMQVLARQGATEQRHLSVIVEALNAPTQA